MVNQTKFPYFGKGGGVFVFKHLLKLLRFRTNGKDLFNLE